MDFAHRLNVHLVTLARYETSRPPKGAALISLASVARQHGQTELAETFEKALVAGLKVKPGGAITFQAPKGFEAHMYAFVDVLTLPEHGRVREKILKLLEPTMGRARLVLALTHTALGEGSFAEKRKKP